jgi:5-methyltetrahydropteroyltriglutamate--homocysteine methyltransferase
VTRYRTILDSAHVFAGILMILLLSILFDLLARWVERRTLVWQTAGRRGPSTAAEPPPLCRRPRRSDRGAFHGRPLLQTTVVGSYPQPDWLVEPRDAEQGRAAHPAARAVARAGPVPAAGAGRRHPARHPRHGARRHRHHHRRRDAARELLQPFRHRARGVDNEHPAEIVNNRGQKTPVPRVVGKIRAPGPSRCATCSSCAPTPASRPRSPCPAPFTMGQQVKDEFYKDAEAMCMDYAAAVNEEAHELVKAGADVIQLDEPWLRNNPEEAKRYAVKVINRALQGITVPTVVHLCFGYAAVVHRPASRPATPSCRSSPTPSRQQISIESAQPKIDLGVLKDLAPKKVMLGVIDLNDPEIETPQKIAERIRAGLKYLGPDKLLPAPDCGMKYLPRATAFGKLKALAEGAAIVRKELG